MTVRIMKNNLVNVNCRASDIELFERLYPTGFELTADNLKTAPSNLMNIHNLIELMLPQFELASEDRSLFLEDPMYAYWIALYVDKGPCADTREVACKNPVAAYLYALDVDHEARTDTRDAACVNPYYAYRYARYVDKEFHKTTWKSASSRPLWREWYMEELEVPLSVREPEDRMGG